MPALAELEAAWVAARADRGFRAELDGLLRDYCGRPSPLYLAERLSERAGREIWLKREDLSHTGSHKINNALGQALLVKRMGKPRVIAETGAGQHGVRHRDRLRAARPRLRRVHGRRGHPPPAAQRPAHEAARRRRWSRRVGRADAEGGGSEAIRDWVTNVGDTHYVLGSAVGPAPYPAIVRDLQRLIGDEARDELLERAGRLPDRVVACVGGGSNAIGIFAAFVADAGVALVGVEAAGEGLDSGRHGAPLTVGGRRASCTARCRRSCRTTTGRSPRRTRSRRPRLPGLGPRARVAARQRPRDVRRGHRRRRARRLPTVARARGDHPGARDRPRVALRPARARRLRARPGVPLRPRRQGPGRGPRRRVTSGTEIGIAGAFASAGKRAALMPYLMGGFPDMETSRAIGQAYADGGRRPRRARRAVLRPARRRPGHPRGGHGGARAGATVDGVLGVWRGARRARPGGGHVLREPRARPHARAFAAALADAGRERADRARPAARGGAAGARRVRRARDRARAARRADDAGRAPGADRRARPRLPLHGLGRPGRPASARRAGLRRRSSGAPSRTPRCRSRSASGSARPSRPRGGRRRAPTASSSAAASCARPRRPTTRRRGARGRRGDGGGAPLIAPPLMARPSGPPPPSSSGSSSGRSARSRSTPSMLAVLIIVIGATIHILKRYLPRHAG